MSKYHQTLAQDLGERVRRTLVNVNAITDVTTVFVWPREDRVVCLIDPLGIRNVNTLLSGRTQHQIQTACQGRRVVFTNHRGAFIQVAYYPEPHVELKSVPIDWSTQPSPLHLPIGMTRRGALWLSLVEMDAILIGGARRMGKTRLLHGWIRALQRGGQAELLLWDGKNGLEFSRYQGETHITVAMDLAEALIPIHTAVQQREIVFKKLGVSSLKEHNARSSATLPILTLIVDEAAFIPTEAQTIIIDLVARCGAFGIHPILATQRPDADVLSGLLRANLSTRIALPVASRFDSQVILGRSGAEKLPKLPGRLLLSWLARQIEAQAFDIELEAPTFQKPTVTTTQLTPDEINLVTIAMQACQGFFKIRELSEQSGLRREVLVDLAKRWELLGWLTPVQANEKGHRLGRKLTPKLLQIAGIDVETGEQGNLGNQVDLG